MTTEEARILIKEIYNVSRELDEDGAPDIALGFLFAMLHFGKINEFQFKDINQFTINEFRYQ